MAKAWAIQCGSSDEARSRAGGAEVVLAGRIPEAKQGQHHRDNPARQAPEPELLVMRGHERRRQGQAVADQAGDDRMRRAQEDLDRSAEALSGVGLSSMISKPPRQTIHGRQGR